VHQDAFCRRRLAHHLTQRCSCWRRRRHVAQQHGGAAAPRPGNTVGQVFAAHAEVLTKAGYAGHFLNACPDASPTVRS
jgi:hypothetical protein